MCEFFQCLTLTGSSICSYPVTLSNFPALEQLIAYMGRSVRESSFISLRCIPTQALLVAAATLDGALANIAAIAVAIQTEEIEMTLFTNSLHID